jgi:hypothetical protein
MKLPFDFSIKLIFRLVFPGVILAAAIFPALQAILSSLGLRFRFEYLFPIAVIASGWLVVVSDMTIYMLFEGRRYWPWPTRPLMIWLQGRRLQRLSALALNPPAQADQRRVLEASVEYALYPINDRGEAYVEHPTRLGNIIESFETYPDVKYGLDSVFYWYRIWVVLDKDLRDEIDSAQALVDSSVYLSFVLYVSAFLMLIYAGIGYGPSFSRLHWLSAVTLPHVPAPRTLCLMAVACLVAGFAIYRLSLPAHAQFGELFKSIFDQYRSKLSFDDLLDDIASVMGGATLSTKPRRDKNRIIWRYLRWHLIRDETIPQNLTVGAWIDRRNQPPPPAAGGP